jgi:hypothetical protein
MSEDFQKKYFKRTNGLEDYQLEGTKKEENICSKIKKILKNGDIWSIDTLSEIKKIFMEGNIWAKITDKLNFISINSFIIGSILLIIFFIINLWSKYSVCA